MGRFSAYKLPLKSMPIGTQNFEYVLDNEFFKNIEGEDVQKGKVKVNLTVKRTADVFELDFDLEGVVQIPCDRCLDDMDHEVNTHETLYVKFGAEYSEESDNVVVIPESDGELNVAWFLYEFIALTIPLKHVHPAGKCNKSMSAKLRKHTARSLEDGEDDDDAVAYDDDDEIDVVPGEGEETDPRWDELKKIIDNN
ncbi:MAG TPA: DUF177 domain-containing protein [Candidatus Barnesiella excrementigallinarum]|nr:DUF177 domain-containing protein [Candidatus Barnesiella excrementigallinarum]